MPGNALSERSESTENSTVDAVLREVQHLQACIFLDTFGTLVDAPLVTPFGMSIMLSTPFCICGEGTLSLMS